MPLAPDFEKRRHSQASMHHRSTKHCLIPSQIIWILNVNNVFPLLLQIDDVVNWMLTTNGDEGVGEDEVEVEWSVNNNTIFKAIIERSGLSQLTRCTYRFVSKLLISSFVERWQLETNTFHTTVGEITLTLDDVGTILSLPTVGRSVNVPNVTDLHGVTLLVSGLGIIKCVSHDEVSTTGGNSVRLEWLQSQFASVIDSDPEDTIQCAARAYLLFLLGCMLFSDKSGDRVFVVYLSLLMDLGSIHTYA
ncbi:protein MAIN-LIKE 1-like [Camellia sinensis]|uniref:protein MAIN-LIKE 1-like n=1 Tax=Camellia sinensis TaxID=4442 RepID=UPI0010364949|nr:protein MAIN-LIKE 1-like [Camellia sinensis]